MKAHPCPAPRYDRRRMFDGVCWGCTCGKVYRLDIGYYGETWNLVSGGESRG